MYEKFMCYCDNNIAQAENEIEESNSAIGELESTIKELTGANAQITAQLADLKEELEENKKSVEEQTAVRQREQSAFASESGETKNNIAALDKAIPKLEAGLNLQQKAALLQRLKQLSLLKPEHGQRLQSLLQANADEQAALGTSAASSKSSDMILGVLHQMRDDFKQSLEDMLKDEQDAIARYDELMASKKAEIAAATEETDKLKGEQSNNEGALSEAKAEYEKTTEALQKAQDRLIDLKTQCSDRSAEYDLATKGRQQELKAIGEAVKILNDENALDTFKKTVPTLVQADKKPVSSPVDPAAQAWAELKQAPAKPSADRLADALLAPTQTSPVGAAADADPAAGIWAQLTKHAGEAPKQDDVLASITAPTFAQVRQTQAAKPVMQPVIKLVSNMGSQLKKDQAQDDEQKEFCEHELEATEDSLKEVKSKAALLWQELATLKNDKTSKADQIAKLEDKIAKQDQMVKDAGETRKKENEAFTKVSAEQTTAIGLIEKAKVVLGSVYGPEKPALVQQQQPQPVEDTDMDQMLGLNFLQTGTQSDKELDQLLIQVGEAAEQPAGRVKQGGGVMALMDEMKKDVEVELAELKKEEEHGQADYEKLVKSSAAERKAKMREKTGLLEALAKVDEKLDIRGGALKGYEEEVVSLSEKQTALHDQCDFLLSNYDVRQKARTQEIEGLARSEAVLSGADFDLHQKRLRG